MKGITVGGWGVRTIYISDQIISARQLLTTGFKHYRPDIVFTVVIQQITSNLPVVIRVYCTSSDQSNKQLSSRQYRSVDDICGDRFYLRDSFNYVAGGTVDKINILRNVKIASHRTTRHNIMKQHSK